MSHFTTIKTQIKDIEALRSAVNELGLKLIPNTTARGYISNKTKGDYVIRLKGPYDIAVNQQPDGTFGLTTDWWDGHVEKEVGGNFGRLLQLYGVHKASVWSSPSFTHRSWASILESVARLMSRPSTSQRAASIACVMSCW